MERLEQENFNTREYYNKALLHRFNELGLDYGDVWRIDALLDKFIGGKLLDVGCGVSPLCVRANLLENTGIYGIDFADKLITVLQAKFPHINYSTGDFNHLPFEDNFFNYVVMGEVIEHSEDPQKLIDEGYRVLKESGILAISTPYNESKENHEYSQHIWSFGIKDVVKMIGEERLLKSYKQSNNIICLAKKR